MTLAVHLGRPPIRYTSAVVPGWCTAKDGKDAESAILCGAKPEGIEPVSLLGVEIVTRECKVS